MAKKKSKAGSYALKVAAAAFNEVGKRHTIKDLERMGNTMKRQILRSLNKTARSRAAELKAAGYKGEMTEPPTRDYSRTPGDELTRAIADLEIFLDDKRSTVSGMDDFVDKSLATLASHKYDFVDRSNLADFGRFMNYVRDLHNELAFPSKEVAQLWGKMQKLGISNKVMERWFTDYLSSESGITDLTTTLDTMSLPSGRKRISSTEVMVQMAEYGLADVEIEDRLRSLGYEIEE